MVPSRLPVVTGFDLGFDLGDVVPGFLVRVRRGALLTL